MQKKKDQHRDEIRESVSNGVVHGFSRIIVSCFIGMMLATGFGLLYHFKDQLDKAGYGVLVDVPLAIVFIGLCIRMILYGKDALKLTKW